MPFGSGNWLTDVPCTRPERQATFRIEYHPLNDFAKLVKRWPNRRVVFETIRAKPPFAGRFSPEISAQHVQQLDAEDQISKGGDLRG